MKKLFTIKSSLLSCLLVLYTNLTYTQTNQWVWMKGDSTVSNYGNYGTQGVGSRANKPGARIRSVSWTDKSGTLWLFGGGVADTSHYKYFNDLWKYTPPNNEWTWVKGDDTVNVNGIYGKIGNSSTDNKPGSRDGSVSWTDVSGNLWLFGGGGYGASGGGGNLNDLWKYNISTNIWTWVNGDSVTNIAGQYGVQGTPSLSNKPGARFKSVGWADSLGNLWLFGGFNSIGGVVGPLNDLWKYNIATNLWTWVKGDKTVNNTGIYGSQGYPSAANKPAGRWHSVTWKDSLNNLWLFGGSGNGASGYGQFNDLWKYNVLTNEWTWVKGDNTINNKGTYGTKGVALSSNKPPGREGSISWKDAVGNLWLFGGRYDTNGEGDLNDLWKYSPFTNEWTWVSGDSTLNNNGLYGTQNITLGTNKPGARFYNVSWTDMLGNLWLFGGYGFSANSFGYLNDLWKYNLENTLPVTIISFTGKLQNEKIKLNWAVQNEQSFDRYEIERSFNSLEYAKIEAVKAINVGQYSYNDNANELRGKKVYYRLKLVDKDGRFSFSPVVVLQIPFNVRFTVHPNPASAHFQLQLDKNISGRVNIEIADLNGKVVVKKVFDVNGSVITMSVNKLVVGTYFVKMIYKDGQYLQKILVVE